MRLRADNYHKTTTTTITTQTTPTTTLMCNLMLTQVKVPKFNHTTSTSNPTSDTDANILTTSITATIDNTMMTHVTH